MKRGRGRSGDASEEAPVTQHAYWARRRWLFSVVLEAARLADRPFMTLMVQTTNNQERVRLAHIDNVHVTESRPF